MTKKIAKTHFYKRIILMSQAHLRLSGLIGAIIFFSLSMTPSLLPRPPIYMGAIAGIAAAIGYAVGILLAWFMIRIRFKANKSSLERPWIVVLTAWPIIAVVMVIVGLNWQNQVRSLLGEELLKGHHILIVLITSVIFFGALILLGRGLHLAEKFIVRHLARFLPRRVSVLIGVLIVAFLVFAGFKGLIFKTFVHVANSTYSSRNATTPDGLVKPASKYVSGGEESLVSWDSLGYMGKRFVARVPAQEDISAWSGKPAKQQIRAYAGILAADTPEARAKLVLEELKRTKAFSRRYLVVATTTGTGWIEPQTADAIAYLTNGDSAIATIQYSYLPSWISMLVDGQNATDAGKALYDEVYDYWQTLPKDSRPQLIAYGLSMGSYGGQAAFSGLSDFRERSEGAIFVGTPSNTELWRQFTSQRDKGSSEILPVYKNGEYLRFAASSEDISQNSSAWKTPRLLYMQHPSDSVVWWSPDLMLNKPDWLKEPRGYDVSRSMQWIPVVTFAQVSIDQFFGTTVPNGHGHNYGNTTVDAWVSVLRGLDWDKRKDRPALQSNSILPD